MNAENESVIMMALRCKKKRIGPGAMPGMTLLELGIVMTAVAIVGTVALTSYKKLDDERDANMVRSGQAVLQSIFKQASERLDTSLRDVDDNYSTQVLNTLKDTFSAKLTGTQYPIQFIHSGIYYQMTISSSSRSNSDDCVAQFYLNNTTGKVLLNSVTGLSTYRVVNGVLTKS